LAAGLFILPAFAQDTVDKTKNAAKKAGQATADKAEDVGDATVKGTKKAGKATKKAAKATGDKAEDVGEATVHGAKKAGREVADKSEDVGEATVKGTKKAGRAVKGTVSGDKAPEK